MQIKVARAPEFHTRGAGRGVDGSDRTIIRVTRWAFRFGLESKLSLHDGAPSWKSSIIFTTTISLAGKTITSSTSL